MTLRTALTAVTLAAFVAACGPAPNNNQSQQQAAPAATPAPAPAAAPAPRPKPRHVEHHESTPAPAPACDNCGTVTAITPVKKEGDASLLGTLAGAAAGGLLGSQFGKGTGKAAMTAAGAVGGAFAGRAAESEIRSSTVYKVTIAMENGGSQEITVPATGSLSVGSKVRVEGNTITPR